MSNIRLDQIKIPAGPLVEYIERRGGVAELPGMGVVTSKDIENPRPVTNFGRGDATISVDSVDRSPDEWRRLRRVTQKVRRARQAGVISLAQADELCCDVLRIHPMEIWGLEWFDFGFEEEEEVMAA